MLSEIGVSEHTLAPFWCRLASKLALQGNPESQPMQTHVHPHVYVMNHHERKSSNCESDVEFLNSEGPMPACHQLPKCLGGKVGDSEEIIGQLSALYG